MGDVEAQRVYCGGRLGHVECQIAINRGGFSDGHCTGEININIISIDFHCVETDVEIVERAGHIAVTAQAAKWRQGYG